MTAVAGDRGKKNAHCGGYTEDYGSVRDNYDVGSAGGSICNGKKLL